MDSTIILMALIGFQSVSLDSNLREFCSKSYFDSFYATQIPGWIKLSRKFNETTYHLWDIYFEKVGDINNTTTIRYSLEVGQTPNSQPIDCKILMTTHFPDFEITSTTTVRASSYQWYINDMLIINNEINGPKVDYTQLNSKFKRIDGRGDYEVRTEYLTEKKSSPQNGSGIHLTGLVCIQKENTVYVLAENTNSINSSNRRQYLSSIRIRQNQPLIRPDSYTYYEPSATVYPQLEFWLHPMNQTFFDFFGIDCKNIRTTDTEEEDSVTTKILFFAFFVFFIFGILYLYTISLII